MENYKSEGVSGSSRVSLAGGRTEPQPRESVFARLAGRLERAPDSSRREARKRTHKALGFTSKSKQVK